MDSRVVSPYLLANVRLLPPPLTPPAKGGEFFIEAPTRGGGLQSDD
jgi:hypothetical protein